VFGAAALARASEADAARALELLLAHGVNHIDTAASYGHAEERMRPWLAHHRGQFFVATKTAQRTRAEARAELHRSLERMATDHVDLWQLHNLSRADEQAIALGPGGALEAALEAREEGLVRFIGVTGHGVQVAAVHRASLERFAFDSVLLPYSFPMMSQPAYAADFEAVLALCEARGVAVQTIKSVARGRWPEPELARGTWYEPIQDPDALRRAVRWVLGRPGLFLNTAGDLDLLPAILAAALEEGPRPTDAEMARDMRALALRPLFEPEPAAPAARA
jgi:aryl-alcohol dehydrogenase-like predicted oxidoreductase